MAADGEAPHSQRDLDNWFIASGARRTTMLFCQPHAFADLRGVTERYGSASCAVWFVPPGQRAPTVLRAVSLFTGVPASHDAPVIPGPADGCRMGNGDCNRQCAIWEPDVLPAEVLDAIRAAHAADAVVHVEWTNEPPWRASWIVEVHAALPALASVLRSADFEYDDEGVLFRANDAPLVSTPPRWVRSGFMPERFDFERYGRQV